MANIPVDNGAEAFIELLNANGVDYIFLNPGTDTVSIQEAIAKFKARGKRTPGVVLCLHESVAMAAAHGYFMVARKPQVVLVHVDVGTQQVGGALHNAQRGRIGVIFCAGRSPSIFEGERRGGRFRPVMWYQDQPDQGGIVRNYVKWEYELRYNENIHHVVQRAFQIAATEPCGPVYLMLPPELLMESVKNVRILDVTRYSAAATPQADTDTLLRVADVLAQAEKPLIITGYSGRNTQSVASLVELAETLGARVITGDITMNFPSRHPLCGGDEPSPYLKEADVVLLIDHDAPYLPIQVSPRPGAKIIQIDIDPTKQNMPLWGFPVDVPIAADSSKAIPFLTQLIRQRVTPEQQRRFQARLSQLQSEHQQLWAKWRELAVARAEDKPISPEWLCYCIAETVSEDTIIVAETVSNAGPVAHQVPRSKPGTLFSHGGSCLGWGLGAALGAKLAAPDKTVVCLIGDGGFAYGCPTAALWAAYVHRAPVLYIVLNNQGYNAIRRNLRSACGEGNFAEKTGAWVGLDIVPSPDYALIAQACHAYGQVVDDPSLVRSALQQALEQVHRGQPAVLDVRINRT